jgi:histone H3/H4
MSGKAGKGTKAGKAPKSGQAKKAVTEVDGSAQDKPRKRKSVRTFARYIMKVLHRHNTFGGQETPMNMGLSKNAMSILHAMCVDLLERMTTEASHFCQSVNRKTISTRDVQAAVKMHLHPEIYTQALKHDRKVSAPLSEAMKGYKPAK